MVVANKDYHNTFATFTQFVKIDGVEFLLNSQWKWAQKKSRKADATCGCTEDYWQYLIIADVDNCKLDKALWVSDDFVVEETGKRPKVTRDFYFERRGDYFQEGDQDTLQPDQRNPGESMSDEHGYIQVNEGYFPVPGRNQIGHVPKHEEIKES